MGMEMPKDRASEGLRIIKESIFDLLLQHTEGLTNVEIATMLELTSSKHGGHRNYLTWSILRIMMAEDRVRFHKAPGMKRGHDKYFAVQPTSG
jgi:hypothetical protein